MWAKWRAEDRKQPKDAAKPTMRAYKELNKDPNDAGEHKTTLIFKKFSLAEEICKEPCLQCPRPPRNYKLPTFTNLQLRPHLPVVQAPGKNAHGPTHTTSRNPQTSCKVCMGWNGGHGGQL
jgi:hypothetical protein